MRTTRLLAPAAAAAGLALAGCGGGGGSAPTAGGVAGTTASQGSGTTVVVRESEYKLRFSTMRLRPGTTTFVAKNAGAVVHALELDGPGVDGRRTGDIQPGESASLTVTLRPGTYEISCPVPGHKALGMDAHLTVGGGAASGSTGGDTDTSGGSAWG
ncbi:MAG TPA: plastocyanin/azurin family copper-binding protein [Gaiellaceae bacterium]|nr:plastocyanin/azurin family copper-binding protein [Gaiellaceae bacterium]